MVNFGRATFRELLICLATGGAVGIANMVIADFASAAGHLPAGSTYEENS
jgi:hypothetical protein